jgi:hypothetical protein
MHGDKGLARARRTIARIALIALVLSGTAALGLTGAMAVADPCNGVFDGVTPDLPIVKTADVTEAHPGDTVTYTFKWHATGQGVDSADLTDCFRVGDGSNATLNALVTPNNQVINHDQTGDAKDTLETVTLHIQIPDDASLIGSTVFDRAKITHGSEESRSDTVGVKVTEAPCTANCSTPTPSPSVGGVTPTPATSVKGVTLGKTGSSQASTLWLGLLFVAMGLALTRLTVRRSVALAGAGRAARTMLATGIAGVFGTARAYRARHRKS